MSIEPPRCSTRSVPRNTTVNSSNSGVWPGSCHPPGLRMCATLVVLVEEFTRPIYSSISLGLLPAASMRVGLGINVGTVFSSECVHSNSHLKQTVLGLPDHKVPPYTYNFAENCYYC